VDAYAVCPRCACLIKRIEMRCPFCDAPIGRAPRAPVLPRMSRAQWLALGALALLGCSGGATELPSNGGAGAEGGSPTGIPSGTFACGSSTCDRATQYCSFFPYSISGQCQADNAGFPFPPQCVGQPTCDCMATAALGSCHCIDLDDGGGIGIRCSACYGAPPTRLERLRRPV